MGSNYRTRHNGAMRRHLIALLFLLLPLPAAAWNAAGHRLVAAIAWHQLSPPSRGFVEQALARYRHAEIRRTAPPDVDMLADAILMREKDRLRRQREKKQDALETLDVGDLIVSGADMLWQLLRH